MGKKNEPWPQPHTSYTKNKFQMYCRSKRERQNSIIFRRKHRRTSHDLGVAKSFSIGQQKQLTTKAKRLNSQEAKTLNKE